MNVLRRVAQPARAAAYSFMAGLPKSKVELHVHLDGSVRTSTLLDVAKGRGIKLPAATVSELKAFTCYSPTDSDTHSLSKFLDTFFFFLPLLRGDSEALERIAYEFCEDQAENGILYSEPRYSPHLLASTVSWPGSSISAYESQHYRELDSKRPPMSPKDVVSAVNKGLQRGSKDFQIMTRSILCCMTHEPTWSMEVVDLAHEFRAQGVVAIDLAGDENGFPMSNHAPAFKKAKELNIHRTVHAGEVGPPQNVVTALEVLHAERIGHGYASVKDKSVYNQVKQSGVHLEACLFSSILTGGVPKIENHPAKQWAMDGVNFSLSTDDPGVMQCNLNDELMRAQTDLGFDPATLTRLTFNAARSSFLPETEKRELLQTLTTAHGISDE